MPRPVYLVGCGKSKLDHPAPARHIYTGSLFQKALEYAEMKALREGADIWILSAKHGLLSPGDIIDPYDLALTSLPAI